MTDNVRGRAYKSVVDRYLIARLNEEARQHEDTARRLREAAVRLAAMIDEPGTVPADPPVDNPPVV